MTEELGQVCGTCWHCCKNPYEKDWLCLYSWKEAKSVKYDDTCIKYKPKNRCMSCYYKSKRPTEEPCSTCIYVGNGYTPIDE